MSKIKTIELKNFKFFADSTDPIQIDGKHLLLYGENGSGKSSIYWALYTLLEAAHKSSSDVAKYFDESQDENLLNIHSLTRLSQSSISLTLDDDTVWDIGKHDTVTIRGNSDAKVSNFASDFLNYRMLYRLLDFRNSEEINLFDLFEKELLDYIHITPAYRMSNGVNATDFGMLWKAIAKGPDKITTASVSGTYPRVGSIDYNAFKKMADDFEEKLKQLVGKTNPKANAILKQKLGINVEFELQFSTTPFTLTSTIYTPPKHSIGLSIKSIDGKALPVTNKKPHIIFNEAKLSAMGLAIRLALLEERLFEAPLRLLVLDDLLISLDMGNREKVIQLILNDYCPKYQVFMLTHDKHLFEVMKQAIKKEEWKMIEMYANEDKKTGVSLPLIIDPSLDYLEKANLYFEQRDYPTCANYQRKWCEQFLKDYMQDNYRLEIGKHEKAIEITKLSTLFGKLQAFFKDCDKELPKEIKDEFEKHSQTVMNPFSHDDLTSPTYRSEIERGFRLIEAFEKLPKLTKKPIAFSGDLIYMKVDSADYIIACTLNSDLTVVKYGEDVSYKTFKVDVKGYRKATTEWTIVNNIKDKTVKEINKMVFKFLETVLPEGYNELTDFKLINGENLDLESLKSKIGIDM
jgi:energy-coupling factor transporter ATP-binding protein EcfA2